MKPSSLLIPILCLFTFSAVKAQQAPLLVDSVRFAFDPDLSYDPTIASPREFLGYRLGEAFTLYAHVVEYSKMLANSSDRVQYREYGKTYEGRPLVALIISSADNMKRIEAVRERHLELVNADVSTANDIIENEPVVLSFSYNIHGNEASGTEAALQTAYRLAAAEDAGTEAILKDMVIILYMCINPDGRDRYVYWYKGMKRHTQGQEPRDLEHYAPWPNGRTNHYWFDLNRDWVWGIHPESRGHTALYQEWMPQVHTDYHEQGYNNNYFTTPGTTPRNKLLPDTYESWADTFGRANIEVFNKVQVNYFTREAFDFFYPGYGSSYPSVMGAVGMLTEQGGISAGRAVENEDGYVLTLRQRVFDHYSTSIATIQKTAEHRAELLRYSYEAWKPGNSKTATKTYVFPGNDMYVVDLIAMLIRQGVKVERATKSFTASDAKDFRTKKLSRKSFPAGPYLVSTDQPRHLFINSVLERNLLIEDSVMYDMATWSAPLAYNLEAYSLDKAVNVATEPLVEAPKIPSGLNNADATYAYVIDWSQRHAPRALAMLWEKGYRVRAAEKAFGDGSRSFSAGSSIVLIGRNPDKREEIERDMRSIASDCPVMIEGFDTGRMLEGMDLASRDNQVIKAPRVAMLVEPPFDTYTSGQIYFLFDRETHLPVERIRTSILRQTDLPKFGSRYGYADLNDYDVLILPGGGEGLEQLFGKTGLEHLKSWLQNGGTLVAQESAATYFTSNTADWLKVELRKPPKDTSEAIKALPYAEREEYFGKKRIPGSAFRAHLDTSHPLAFGLPEEVYSLKLGNQALEPDASWQTVGRYHEPPYELMTAGYASIPNLELLTGGAFAGVLPVGDGKLVYLLDNTQYRMFWRGPSRMMQNAVMLLPGF